MCALTSIARATEHSWAQLTVSGSRLAERSLSACRDFRSEAHLPRGALAAPAATATAAACSPRRCPLGRPVTAAAQVASDRWASWRLCSTPPAGGGMGVFLAATARGQREPHRGLGRALSCAITGHAVTVLVAAQHARAASSGGRAPATWPAPALGRHSVSGRPVSGKSFLAPHHRTASRTSRAHGTV